MLEQPLDFTGCSRIQCFNSPPSLICPFSTNTVSVPLTELVRLLETTYLLLCNACVTYGTLCHAIGYQVLPTLSPA